MVECLSATLESGLSKSYYVSELHGCSINRFQGNTVKYKILQILANSTN